MSPVGGTHEPGTQAGDTGLGPLPSIPGNHLENLCSLYPQPWRLQMHPICLPGKPHTAPPQALSLPPASSWYSREENHSCCGAWGSSSGERLEEQGGMVSWDKLETLCKCWEEVLVPRTRCGLGPWQTSDWGYGGLCHKPALLPRTLAYQKAVDLWPLQVSFNTPHTSSGLGRSHPSTVLVLSPCTWPGPWAEASLPCDSELGVRLGGWSIHKDR